MPSHKLRQRVNHDISAIGDWAQKDMSCNGIVHNQGDTVAVGDVSQHFNIGDIACRVPTLSQKIARVSSSTSFYIAAGSSLSANRT
jgi:hypothetical protein